MRAITRLAMWAVLSVGAFAALRPMPARAAPFDPAAACAKGEAGWADIVKQAEEEGKVVFYSTRSVPDNARFLAAFMKHYPQIHASAVRLIGSTMSDRVDQEIKAGLPTADVLLYSDPNWLKAKLVNHDLVAPCGPSVKLWKNAGKFYDTPELVPATNEPWVLGYNTRLAKPAPEDWDSLLTPAYAGKLGLNEVSGMTVAIWCEVIASKAGADYFEKLAALKPKIYPNSAPLTQAMAAGEIAWSPYSLATTIEPLKAKGAPIDWIVPKHGTYLLTRWALDLKAAPDPAAALLLMDFLMSQEGQQDLNGNKQGISVTPDIKLVDPLNVDLKLVEVVDQTHFPDSTLPKWVDTFNRLYR